LLLVNGRVHEHLKFFNEHSKLSGCCHSGLEFPTKIQAQKQDHKEGGVCKKLNSAPFLHVPLPSPSIPAALHEIYHEVGKFLLHCTIFLVVDVPSHVYGQIYNIFSNDKIYNVNIENFPRCSCVYILTMLASSLGDHGVYVQCKHVYYVLQMIMFRGFTKEFIHHYTWSRDEVQRLLKHSKTFELL